MSAAPPPAAPPPQQSPEERLRTALRVFAAAAAMVIITLLLMQIIHRITDAPAEAQAEPTAEGAPPPEPAAVAEGAEVAAPAAPPPVPESESGLRISAVEPVKVRVEIDGVERYDAVLCASLDTTCEERVLKFPLAAEMAVEVADLTRLRVSYNGARVEPLGNLSASRRLVFIDDARR